MAHSSSPLDSSRVSDTNPDTIKALWRVPPTMVISDSPRDVGEAPELWSWDIRPDCAYWLSLRGFNPRYRFQIQNCTFVRDWITCPYFSVEFKRDGESEDVAVRQVCAAGALALFNRCYLHLEARKAATPIQEPRGQQPRQYRQRGDGVHPALYLDLYRTQICLLGSASDLGWARSVGWLRHEETIRSRLH